MQCVQTGQFWGAPLLETMCPPPSMNPEAEYVGKGLSQPLLAIFAGKSAPASRILLMAVQVWEILSLLRVGGFL